MLASEDQKWMDLAVEQAEIGRDEGGIPIGSVIVADGKLLGRGHNRRVQRGDPILHGEMDALQNAGRQRADVYARSTLYTTLSPCAMCSGAALLYGVPRIVIGENETFMGEESLLKQRGVELVLANDPRCIELMKTFIAMHPELWNEDIGTV